MISFRFHLVSIVAMFLALGLGVLTGTTVVNQGIVARLEDQTNQLDEQGDELRQRIDQLEGDLGEWEEFGDAVLEPLTGARLAGVPAVLVTQEATDARTLDRVRDALDVAGAEIAMELRVESRMALTSEDDRGALEEVIDSVGATDPSIEAARDVAAQISFGETGTDVITELVEAGFLSQDGSLDPPGERPVEDPLILVVMGDTQAPLVEPSSFLLPFTEQLVANGQEVAAAEMERSAFPFVTTLRSREAAGQMVTVDHADRLPGMVALILAAEELLETGTPGHYGAKSGASGLLPPIALNG